jgi:hypothetical protein
MTETLTVDLGHCDNCSRTWPAPLIRSGACSSGEGSFCPLCMSDSAVDIADAICDLCDTHGTGEAA